MPVAGGNVESFRLTIVNGCLVEYGKSRCPNDMATDDLDGAIALMKLRKTVYLRAYGSNLADLKAKLSEQGIAV